MQADAGEIVGLVGANGAGKTTLIKILAGVIYPTSGTAKVLGFTPWERKNELRRQISLIMGQKQQLWWDLPAADCFLLLREIYQIPKKKYNQTLDFLLETLGVKEQMNIQVRRLSLGERMKMELIAALLHEPKIVFLDEPTIGLDLTTQRAIRNFILSYRQEHQPAMILTSHYMEDIERLCKRIIIIRSGEFIYDGPIADITAKYATHKIVSLHLKADQFTQDLILDMPKINQDLLKGWGYSEDAAQLLSCDELTLKVKVLREKAPEVASALLQHYAVLDMNVGEVEIGTIIEAIMREGT